MPGPRVSHKRPFAVHCRAAYMRPLHLSNILPCSNGTRPRNGQDRSPACRKTSLCETDSSDTGEVALAPEGERCPEGAEGENLAIAQNISGNRTVLSPTACGRSPLTEGAKG